MLENARKLVYAHFTMREITPSFGLHRKLVLVFFAILIATYAGPFGTYLEMSLAQRAVFWTLLFTGAALAIMPVLYSFFHTGFVVRSLPLWLRVVAASLLGAVPITAIAIFLFKYLHGQVNWQSLPDMYLKVLFITAIMNIVEYVFWPMAKAGNAAAARVVPVKTGAPLRLLPDAEAPGPARTGAPAPPAIMKRLPPEMRQARVISISMQDHYAHISTTMGEQMVLLRLSDAISLLEGLPGVQTHRSHWAAAAFARELRRDGRRHLLLLADGRSLPVAASRLDEVRKMLRDRPGMAASTAAG